LLSFGVTAALPTGAAGFDPAKDLRIYLFAGFDSFVGLRGPGSWPFAILYQTQIRR
jgi:hypothetical protein